MRKYLSISKGIFLEWVSYRVHFIFILFGNLLFIALIYFLWQAIYRSSATPTLNGMTFKTTFIYLTLASSFATLFETWVEWRMSKDVIKGDVALLLVKPMDYQTYVFFQNMGIVSANFIFVVLPSFFVVLFIMGGEITFGINIPIFFLSLMFALAISFTINFIIGIISFYTESIWGIIITKEAIVLLLSGAVIPLPFFPGLFLEIVKMLPFQAIYNIPLQVLTNHSYTGSDYIKLILIQLFWFVLILCLGRLFLRKALKVITVNGG